MPYTVKFLLWLFLVASLWAGEPRKRAPEPLWRVDLRHYGYTGFVPEVEKWDIRQNAWPICFIDNQKVVATFITRASVEEKTRLSRRQEPQAASPLKLHGVVLNNSNGQRHAVREWPANRPRAWVFPVAGRKFLVLTNDKLVLFDSGLETLKEFPFPINPGTHVDMWQVFTSPTGRSILYEYSDPTGFHSFWIDAQDLEVRKSWTDPDTAPLGWGISISDERIAKSHEFRSPPYGSEVLVRTLGGNWQVVCKGLVGCGGPNFINENTLLLDSAFGIELVHLSGELLMKRNAPQGTMVDTHRPLVASQRDRFAVMFFKEKGGFPLLDIMPDVVFDQVMVYDMTQKEWIFTLHAKKAKLKKFSGIALSPDGTRIAVLADGILQVYSVGN